MLVLSAGLLLAAQTAAPTGGVRFPNAEPLMSVRTKGEKSFAPGVPGRINSVEYVITQTDLDSFGPADKRYDRSSTVRPLLVRSMEPVAEGLAWRVAASLRGVDEEGNFTWDAIGYARNAPGVYRDEWEAFNDSPRADPAYDLPLRFIRVVELKYPGTPQKSFPPLQPSDKKAPIKGEDDERLSKELRESLEKTLDATQQQILKNGRELEVLVDTLPGPTRQLAQKYVEVRWSRGWSHLQDTLKLDRGVGISLWLSPASFELANVNGRLPNKLAHQLVGVNATLTDGRGVYF